MKKFRFAALLTTLALALVMPFAVAEETIDPAQLMERFAALGQMRTLDPAAPEVQTAIHALRQFITDHFYPCTPEILAGLGEMYTADERFRRNIDKAGGDGTAEFVAKAIRAYRGE